MSRQIALDTIWLKPTSRLAHTDYSMEYHHDYIRKRTGADPSQPDARRRFYDFWKMDMLWNSDDGLHGNWGQRGRATDMGHAVYAADGGDMRNPQAVPVPDSGRRLGF